MSDTRLVADDEGIWRHDAGLPPIGRRWAQIASIVAHKIHPTGGIVLVLGAGTRFAAAAKQCRIITAACFFLYIRAIERLFFPGDL